MFRALRLLIVFVLSTGAATVQPATRLMAFPSDAGAGGQPVALKNVAAKAADLPFGPYEFQAEQDLLALANQSRQQAGAAPLVLDAGLSKAARIHGQAMLVAGELSHRLDGEPALDQRLAVETQLQLDQEGENVALDYDAEHGHQHLMLSPPHRANLLNPDYNVVGLGVIRSGERIYIVQDFGHALPSYSPEEVKERVSAAVNRIRRDAGLSSLPRHDLLTADQTACSMARADTLATAAVHKLAQRYTVLTFTTLRPQELPSTGNRAIATPKMLDFSLGACYGRTLTYPTGVYWVVLSLE